MKLMRRGLVLLTLAFLLAPSVLDAQRGNGKGKPKDAPPPDPVFVVDGGNSIDVMDYDGSNRTSIWSLGTANATDNYPTWIPGENAVVFAYWVFVDGGPNQRFLSTVDFSFDAAGQIIPGQETVLLTRAGDNINYPSWHWRSATEAELLYRGAVWNADPREYYLEILDANSGSIARIYEAPPDHELRDPIRSPDGSLIWVIQQHNDERWENGSILEIDVATGTVTDLITLSGAGFELWFLAAARTFNGFAYNHDPTRSGTNTTFLWDGSDSSFLFGSHSTPRSFSADDSLVILSKQPKKQISLIAVDVAGGTELEVLMRGEPNVDMKH